MIRGPAQAGLFVIATRERLEIRSPAERRDASERRGFFVNLSWAAAAAVLDVDKTPFERSPVNETNLTTVHQDEFTKNRNTKTNKFKGCSF
jgi:hypothetical protein